MAKRTIRVKINQDGSFSINNAGNPDEARILSELEILAELANGSKKGYKVEKHVHTHATAHTHDHDHDHDHNHAGGG